MSFSVPSPVATMLGVECDDHGQDRHLNQTVGAAPVPRPRSSFDVDLQRRRICAVENDEEPDGGPPVAAVLPATRSFDTVYLAVVVLVALFTPSPPVRGSIEPRRAGSVTKSITAAPMPATTKFELIAKVTSKELKVVVPPGGTVFGEPSPTVAAGRSNTVRQRTEARKRLVTSSAPASVSLNNTIVKPDDAKARSAARSTEIRRRMEVPHCHFGRERDEPRPDLLPIGICWQPTGTGDPRCG